MESHQPKTVNLVMGTLPRQTTVRAGLGIDATQAPIGLADADLVPVLPDLLIHPLDAWVVAHEDSRRTPRIAVVFEHLVTSFRTYIRPGKTDSG